MIALLAAGAACIDARAVDFSTDVDCYIGYLKTNHDLADDFPIHGTKMAEGCDEAVESFVDATYKDAEAELTSDEGLKDNTKCIMERLHHHKFADHKMLEKVYELSHTMTAEEKKTKISEAEELTKVGKVSGIQHCITEKDLGAQFDLFFKHKPDTDEFEVYCKRKYVTEHNLINTEVYHFEINEKDVDFGHLNCDMGIKAAGAKFEERLAAFLKKGEDKHANTEDESECVKNVHLDGKFFEITLVVDVLADLGLTEEQQAIERKRFVEAMGTISGASMRCIVPKHE